MPINKGYFDKHVVIMIFLLRLPGDAIRVVGKCLKMLYLSGFTVYLVFRQIIVNYRKFTSFIAKMGYGWGTIYLKMGYEN